MKTKRIRIGGSEFDALPRSDLPVISEKVPTEGEIVLVPYRPPDPHLEFPADVQLQNAYYYVGSGLAAHAVERDRTTVDMSQEPDVGFAATDLVLFREDDWFGECFQVLSAHRWLDRGGEISSEIVTKVASFYGQAEIQKAKELYKENWGIYVGELAAVQFAQPLSRLWYVANMMSLYYIHRDDMRLGFLWAEYQIRMRHEMDSVRGKKSVANAQAGGAQRARLFDDVRHEIIEMMDSHVERGRTVSNAAALTFKAGLGSSAGANRKLWTRHRRK